MPWEKRENYPATGTAPMAIELILVYPLTMGCLGCLARGREAEAIKHSTLE
jgi:hypothetical protein